MTEENKDLNNSQLVADGDLNNADPVNQQGLNNAGSADQQNQDETLADGTSTDKTVKYEDLKKATDRATTAEEQTMQAQRDNDILRAQMQGMNQTQTQTSPKTAMEQAMDDCNVIADEMYGEAQVRVMNRKDEIDRALSQQQQSAFASQQFAMQHPDMNEVVGSVSPVTGQFMASKELLSFAAKNPNLAGACTSVEVAYDLVMRERKLTELKETQSVNQEQVNRQNLDNVSQPLGGSAAGGGGAGEVQGEKMLTRQQVKDIETDIADGKYDK